MIKCVMITFSVPTSSASKPVSVQGMMCEKWFKSIAVYGTKSFYNQVDLGYGSIVRKFIRGPFIMQLHNE